MLNFDVVKRKSSYWLIGITAILLLSLLVNQVFYVFKAAHQQEVAFNDKADIALELIIDRISENMLVCSSLDNCLYTCNYTFCSKVLNTEKEWKSVDSIIHTELQRFDIDLNYNFDFCKNIPHGPHGQNKDHTYTKNMDKVFQKAGVIMYLEFPDKSKYLFRQMGSVFISSILLILFITIAFIMTFRFYKNEKRMAERIKDFLNNMTHEFKTPLANISFANNMIGRQLDDIDPGKIKKYTQIIRVENERILENCEDILQISKQENSIANSYSESIDVHEIIHQLKNSFTSTSVNPDLDITLNLGATKSMVTGKNSFLYNALSNIIDNGIKYSEGAPKISISTINEKNNLLISISDYGIGIDKNNLKYIFDEFYRVPTGDQHDVKGFGLGLSYVKMVVEQMKGEVTLTSTLGEGSVFIIKLPLSDV